MKVAGFQKLSLCDYPGKVSAVIFTQGCNFLCRYCHNSQLIPALPPDGKLLDEDDILRNLQLRKKHYDAVVVTGGEPTLHADLPQFLKKNRKMGFLVKLDTNGTRPEMLKEIIDEKLCDFVAMDIKAPLDKYGVIIGRKIDISRIEESLGIIISSGISHQFRTTWDKELLSEEDIKEIRKLIGPSDSLQVQECIY